MENLTWDECKQKINELPLNYTTVIDEMSKKHPERVSKYVTDNGYRVTVQLKSLGKHEVLFELVKLKKEDDPSRAVYAMYNTKTNTCFIRNLLVEDPTNI